MPTWGFVSGLTISVWGFARRRLGLLPNPDTIYVMRPRFQPLPPRGGLTASRVRAPEEVIARDFLLAVVNGQRHRHPEDGPRAVDRRFSAGEVVDRRGVPLTPTQLLDAGDDVYFYRMPAPEPHVPFEITTVYEDDRILVVNKPPFLATTPKGAHITETAVVRLRRATGNEELAPAHRLDRHTSGLLLFTKKREFRGAYQEMFTRRDVQKTYHAEAALNPQLTAPAVWRSRISKTPGDLQAHTVEGEPNAETLLAEVVPHGDTATYVLKPHTGRTHQLRLHMCEAGVPIINDPLYPTIRDDLMDNMTKPLKLTAHTLAFTDPVDGTTREFSL